MDTMLKRILIPMVVALVSRLALLAVRGITFRLLHRWAKRTKTARGRDPQEIQGRGDRDVVPNEICVE